MLLAFILGDERGFNILETLFLQVYLRALQESHEPLPTADDQDTPPRKKKRKHRSASIQNICEPFHSLLFAVE